MFTADQTEALKILATEYGIEKRSLIALAMKESAGRPFWSTSRGLMPAMRPEGHYFYRALQDDPVKLSQAIEQGLAARSAFVVKVPNSYNARYAMFDRMVAIDAEAAAASCSWGWGQVMGANFASLGYSSAWDLYENAVSGFYGQSRMVCEFVEVNGLTPFLNDLPNRKSATYFAERYNGPAHKRNNYVDDLIQHWANGEQGSAIHPIKQVQKNLTALGYEPGAIDGLNGPATRAAVRAFQADRGLVADGIAGPMTQEALAEALKPLTHKKEQTRMGLTAGGGVATVATASMILNEVSALRATAAQLFSDLGFPPQYLAFALALLFALFVFNYVRRHVDQD